MLVMVFLIPLGVNAQETAADLAKKLANPVASLISVPFQNNTDYGIGDFNGTRNTLNIQPVVPVSISENLNLINRIIMPVITQYNITGGADAKQNGIGDFVLSGFISPKSTKSGVVWGAGPVFLLPVGSDEFLTADKFGVGPTAVVLKQKNGFTFGGLVNQIWSVAGDEDRNDISQLFYQPFITYNWPSAAGISVVMEGTMDWENDRSTLFLIPSASALTAIGKQKVQINVGPRLNLVAPEGSRSDWGWRANLIFLFPK